jgi:hypothetical protein
VGSIPASRTKKDKDLHQKWCKSFFFAINSIKSAASPAEHCAGSYQNNSNLLPSYRLLWCLPLVIYLVTHKIKAQKMR